MKSLLKRHRESLRDGTAIIAKNNDDVVPLSPQASPQPTQAVCSSLATPRF
eukprot:COSAG04_NODE_18778_length_433_cov_0.362275_2_plen_50_part_01